jgi:hypothetical protein
MNMWNCLHVPIFDNGGFTSRGIKHETKRNSIAQTANPRVRLSNQYVYIFLALRCVLPTIH